MSNGKTLLVRLVAQQSKTENPCKKCDRNYCCSHNCNERDEWEDEMNRKEERVRVIFS